MNILEQSIYRDVTKVALTQVRIEYDGYQSLINDIRAMRDKVYAHNDKTVYKDWQRDKDSILDNPSWKRIIELLRWAKSSILALRSTYGDSFPLGIETQNDIKNILSHNLHEFSRDC